MDKDLIRYLIIVTSLVISAIAVVSVIDAFTDLYHYQWEVVYQGKVDIECIKAGMQVLDGNCVVK